MAIIQGMIIAGKIGQVNTFGDVKTVTQTFYKTEKPKKKYTKVNCESCSASLDPDEEIISCDYCGTIYEK